MVQRLSTSFLVQLQWNVLQYVYSDGIVNNKTHMKLSVRPERLYIIPYIRVLGHQTRHFQSQHAGVFQADEVSEDRQQGHRIHLSYYRSLTVLNTRHQDVL